MSEFEFIPCEKCKGAYERLCKINQQKTILLTELERERDEARRVLWEFLASGVEHDDPRMDYITMQVDRVTIAAARAAAKSEGGEYE